MFPMGATELTEFGESVPDGRRDRKKLQTRAELVREAVRLFAERGYDNTTIEDITEAADVSPRTFFRYFPSKEAVLFPSPNYEPFMARVRNQPVDVSDIDAVRDAYLSLFPLSPVEAERTLLFKKAVLSIPALEGRNLMLQRAFRDQMAEALAARRGLAVPDDSAVIAASVAQTVMQLAFDRWAAADGNGDLDTLLRDHFALIGRIVEPAVAPPRRRG